MNNYLTECLKPGAPYGAGSWFLICLILVALCFPTVTLSQGKDKKRPPSPVQVTSAKIREVRPQLTLIGNVEAFTEGNAYAEAQGLVEKFPIEEGDYLEKGQLIARLDSTQLNLELEKMRHDKERNKALLNKELKEFQRFKTLQESESISVQDLDREFSEAESARHRYNMLDAAVRLLEDRLSKKTIKAPFSGYVTEELAHVGKWLRIGDNVVSIAQVDPIYITVKFPQGHIHEIHKGDKVTVNLAGLPEKNLRGKISAIVPQGDESSRTFPVKIHMANPRHTLKPGMLSYVTFGLGKAREALTVPKDAVVTTPDQKRIVFVVKDGVAIRKEIRLGDASEDYVEIQGDGLSAGVQVVTVGNERLRPGQPVKISGQGDGKQAKKSNSPGRSRQ
jgi:RND family efflux transporter MFP subunit